MVKRLLAALLLAACGPAPRPSLPPPPSPPAAPAPSAPELPRSTPEAEGVRSAELIELSRWIRDAPVPIFSLLISRRGKLIYELYTGGIERDDAHYLMSATKSMLSALIGIAIDRGLIKSADAPVAELLPAGLFPSDADRERFTAVSLKQVMGMAALDDPDPPRDTSPAAVARWRQFWAGPNRAAIALTRPILREPFQYNDATPSLAVAALQYASGESALDFAEETLFHALGFRNAEWMHQDRAGVDNGGYGLRLRPIDMQKLGVLFLQHGSWNGAQVVSRAWVERSWSPWNKSRPELDEPDYGWFWWAQSFAPGWRAHLANGWKGQRIAVFPAQELVVTMTGHIDNGSEGAVFARVVKNFVKPALDRFQPGDAASGELAAVLGEVQRGAPRFDDFIDYRMVPSARPKQRHRPFAPAR